MRAILITINDNLFNLKTVGRKSYNLGIMRKMGLPTLEGITLIPPISEKDMKDAWNYFSHNKLLAVRSSMLNEDGDMHSMAGKFETILGVETYKSFKKAVNTVLNSNSDSMQSAVLIQNMFDSHISGVLFTRTLPDNNQLFIESTYGLGETLVGGMVTPDQYWVNRDTLEIDSSISEKKAFGIFMEKTPLEVGEILNLSFGNTRKIACVGKGNFLGSIGYFDRQAPSLSKKQIQYLVDVSIQIEELFGCPQDIEWGICGEEIKILQSRPITSYLGIYDLSIKREYEENVLTGLTASKGLIEGVVRTSFKEGEIINEPFIYVGFETKPELLYQLGNLIGIATEHGGILCHASIVARELEIPCLVGVKRLTSEIKQGDKIILNATEGYIERKDKEND